MRQSLAILLLAGLPLFSVPGCSGKPVDYARTGEPHCPNGTCGVEVPSRSVRCPRCATRLSWTGGYRSCWHCDGVKTCPACGGSGQESGRDGSGDCYFCQGTGECQQCGPNGLVQFGGS